MKVLLGLRKWGDFSRGVVSASFLLAGSWSQDLSFSGAFVPGEAGCDFHACMVVEVCVR